MQTALKLTARVMAGHRVEFTAPELSEGEVVELIVLRSNDPSAGAFQYQSAWEYLQSLPRVERTAEEWDEIEREFRDQRDSWDR